MNTLPALDRSTISPFAKVATLGLIVIVCDQLTQVFAMASDFPLGGSEWRFQAAALILAKAPAVAAAAVVTMLVGRLAQKSGAESFGRWVIMVAAPLFVLSAISVWFDGASVKSNLSGQEITDFTRQWSRVLALAAVGVISIIWVWRRSGRVTRSK